MAERERAFAYTCAYMYTMFNMVCKKGVRKVFHNVFHKVFTMRVVIRCVQEIFTMCSQEICTGG